MLESPPVIVVGAGRSGTKLLRDVICGFEGFGTWPCDEINYIWRHGNRNAPTDELQAADARPEVKRFIAKAFERQARRQSGATIVEKTCANSLRVGFVNEVFPDARFVYLVRDGRDVVASAMKRWKAPLDLPYLARKARFVPAADLPHYALRYLGARLRRLSSRDGQLGSWGPRFAGMDEMLTERPLAEVCARQWLNCVEAAEAQQSTDVSGDRIHRLRYEDLVSHPADELDRLAVFLGASAPAPDRLPAVTTANIGRWRVDMSASDQAAVTSLIDGALQARGYAT